MIQHWTFGQKIGAGFAVIVALTVVIGTISVYALRNVVASKDHMPQAPYRHPNRRLMSPEIDPSSR